MILFVCLMLLLLLKSLVACCRKLHHVSICLKYGCKILVKHAVCDEGVKCCDGSMIRYNTKILNYKVRTPFDIDLLLISTPESDLTMHTLGIKSNDFIERNPRHYS